MRGYFRFVILVAVFAVACGSSDQVGGQAASTSTPPTVPTSAQASPSTPTPTTTTTTLPTTTTTTLPTTTVSTVPSTTITTEPPSTALDSLAGLFSAAEDLDRNIAAAAVVFNAGFDQEAGTVSAEAIDTIGRLTAVPLIPLIPPGMAEDLETAVLAVYTDLDSRIAALDGGVRYLDPIEERPTQVEYALQCLSNGSTSRAHYTQHVDAARALAAQYPPITPAAPDSPDAGILAVRIAVIGLWNSGCDSCGGASYDTSLAVNWDGRVIPDPDDPSYGVEFDATYDDSGWVIHVNAC